MVLSCASMDAKPNPMFVFGVLLLCLYFQTHVSFAADTISANQSLTGDETIVSAGGIFELGFFQPGNNISNFYIGVWYSEQVVSEKTIVWVANREKPISDRFSSILRISDGNLVLFNESKISIWSTNLTPTTTSASVQAILLDTGNLILRPDSTSTSSSLDPLWQSFDHLTHTWLPGSRIGFNKITKKTQFLTSWKSLEDPAPGLFSLEVISEGDNISYVLVWNRTRHYWSSGAWDESTKSFRLIPEMRRNELYNYSYVTNENRSYFTYSLSDPKAISRFVVPTSGQIQQRRWLDGPRSWNYFWTQPGRQCNVYAICGAFGSCSDKLDNYSPFCSCLSGFKPKSQSDWDLQDYSGGCSRPDGGHCGEDANRVDGKVGGFLEIRCKILPENKQNVSTADNEECRSICLSNCSCTAYAYNSTTGCSTWNGQLLNLQETAAGDRDGRTLYVKVPDSEIRPKVAKRSSAILIVSVIMGFLALVFVFGCFLWRKKTMRRKRGLRKKYDTKRKVGLSDTELPLFSLEGILAATNNFSEANKLGEGGFGPVYKGILAENQVVAIKRLSKKSRQGLVEFMNELELIAKLQHINLVRLLGCCNEGDEMILIYEYMPNRSLDKFLFDPSANKELDWGKRFRILEGTAQGVLYIHKYTRLKIIHRDLKASNVLLDESMNPKISDFGMAKIFEINQTEANTNRVVGTYGYMSPEYARYGQFSEKLDVFSFGVLLLEIVSGKKNGAFYRFEDSQTIAGWAWELWKEGRGMEVIDASVRESCRPDEALRCIQVGFLCVQEAPADRPTMSLVIRMLQGIEATSIPVSKQPAFSTHWNSGAVGSSFERPIIFSNNAVTMSLPEGR